jgi:hypothetical protein
LALLSKKEQNLLFLKKKKQKDFWFCSPAFSAVFTGVGFDRGMRNSTFPLLAVIYVFGYVVPTSCFVIGMMIEMRPWFITVQKNADIMLAKMESQP